MTIHTTSAPVDHRAVRLYRTAMLAGLGILALAFTGLIPWPWQFITGAFGAVMAIVMTLCMREAARPRGIRLVVREDLWSVESRSSGGSWDAVDNGRGTDETAARRLYALHLAEEDRQRKLALRPRVVEASYRTGEGAPGVEEADDDPFGY